MSAREQNDGKRLEMMISTYRCHCACCCCCIFCHHTNPLKCRVVSDVWLPRRPHRHLIHRSRHKRSSSSNPRDHQNTAVAVITTAAAAADKRYQLVSRSTPGLSGNGRRFLVVVVVVVVATAEVAMRMSHLLRVRTRVC